MDEEQGKVILVIDDDPALLRLVSTSLGDEGFRVVTTENSHDGLRLLHKIRPDLLALDLNLPKRDGWTICEQVRAVSKVPILLLSTWADLEDVVRALEMGADDYILKPFRMREFIARVRTGLRRAAFERPPPPSNVIYRDRRLTVNVNEHRVMIDGEPVRLTPTEFKLLVELLAASPQVVPYRRLLEQVWGWEYVDDIDYLRVYIWHLRRKIEPDPRKPLYIVNEHGVGYRFERQDQAG